MGSRRRAVALSALLLIGAVVWSPVGTAAGSQSGGGPEAATIATTAEAANITITQHVRLTPETPGEVRVKMAVTIPDRVESFAIGSPSRSTVTETDGFTQADGERYEWNGDEAPTLTYEFRANETVAGGGPEPVIGTYLFADAGSWALVRPPQTRTSWSWRGEDVSVEWRLNVPGEGASGDAIAYLGPQQTRTREAHGQTFELIVPERASMTAQPSAVLETLATASDELRVGDRDEEVVTIVAPEEIDWGVRGLQTGDSDMYVLADQPLNVADNAWLHEYVHTRQRLNTTASTKWLVEGGATYYAALLALEADQIGFGAFENQLDQGTKDRYDDVVLGDNTTWTRLAEYDKGSLVTGEIDRRLRLATNRTRSFETAFRKLNQWDSRFSHRELLDIVSEVGNRSVRAATDRYVRTDDGPEMWTRNVHETAFSTAPVYITYESGTLYRIDGEYRNQSVESVPTLVTGERLTVPVQVTNEGGEAGEFDVAMRVDDEPVARATGRLDAGNATTVELSDAFESPGTYQISVAEKSFEVTVSEPASPTISSLRVDRTALEGPGVVALSATVQNDATIPATGVISFTRDGTVVAEKPVSLSPGANRSIETAVQLRGAGEYVLGANDRTVSVTVRQQTTASQTHTATSASGETTDENDRGMTTTSGPGFNTLLAALAVLLAIRLRS